MPAPAANLAAALDYRERGWAVLPLEAGGKRPHARVLRETHGSPKWRGFQQRPASEPEIREWFARDPDAGLAILTGSASKGLVVADIDDPPGNFRHPPTPTVRTGRGLHLYAQSGVRVNTRSTSWGDVKGEGGYVAAPPSLHPAGSSYEWALSPDEIDLADFAELALDELPLSAPPAGSPLVSNISDCGGEAEDLASTATGDQLAAVESAVAAALRVLGTTAPLGSPFRCVLPGHSDRKPSASLYRMNDGVWRYADWHAQDGRKWWSLAEVRAAQVAGRILPPFTTGPLTAMWYRRLFYEAGVRGLAVIELPPLLPGAPESVERTRRGFELLLAIREMSEPGVGAPFTRQFAADWCGGLSLNQARGAIDELLRQEIIVRIGRHGRMWLYRPGPGPTTHRQPAEPLDQGGRR